MTLLPVTEYQLQRMLPKHGSIYFRAKESVFNSANPYSTIQINCDSNHACGYLSILRNAGHAELCDAHDNVIFTIQKQQDLLRTVWNIESKQHQRLGFIVKAISLGFHHYTIYNAYENRISYAKTPRWQADSFTFYSPQNRLIGSISQKKDASFSVLIETGKNERGNPSELLAHNEKTLLIITSALIHHQHFGK